MNPTLIVEAIREVLAARDRSTKIICSLALLAGAALSVPAVHSYVAIHVADYNTAALWLFILTSVTTLLHDPKKKQEEGKNEEANTD
jgi:uncharacterized membrane protein